MVPLPIQERRSRTRDPQEEDNITVAIACVPEPETVAEALGDFARGDVAFNPKSLAYNLARNENAAEAIRRFMDTDEEAPKALLGVFSEVLGLGQTSEALTVAERLLERYQDYDLSLSADLIRANMARK